MPDALNIVFRVLEEVLYDDGDRMDIDSGSGSQSRYAHHLLLVFSLHERSQLIFFDTAWNKRWQPVSNAFCSVSTRQSMDQEVCFLLSHFVIIFEKQG